MGSAGRSRRWIFPTTLIINGPNWQARITLNATIFDLEIAVNPAYWYDLIAVIDATDITMSIATNNAAPVQVFVTTIAAAGITPDKSLHAACSGYNYDGGNHVYLVDTYEEKIVWLANRMLLYRNSEIALRFRFYCGAGFAPTTTGSD
jgi:hypothetical protein